MLGKLTDSFMEIAVGLTVNKDFTGFIGLLKFL